jgi:2-C-methyl-D-erythritol 4-phosphate cytidylyltransferase
MKVIAIIPAGGGGKRALQSIPKQFVKFDGKELIAYTLDVFQKSPLIDGIVIAAGKKYFKLLKNIKKQYKFFKIIKIVEGGKERQDSVYNALTSVKLNKTDLVVVHDAARPLLPAQILKKAILTAKKKGNALVCIKSRDTLIKANKFVEGYINRNKVHYVQTPQVFRYSDLLYSMELAYGKNFIGTDESMLAKRAGFKINLVEGSILNFKITTANDVRIFKKLAKFFFKIDNIA